MSTKLTAENNGQHEGVLSLWGPKEGTFKRELHKSHTSHDDDDVDWWWLKWVGKYIVGHLKLSEPLEMCIRNILHVLNGKQAESNIKP